jgi:hypothetical protein
VKRTLDGLHGLLLNGAVVNLNNRMVSDNNVMLGAPGADLGGGIYNLGTMTLNNSTVSDNSSSQAVGGIDNDSGLTSTPSLHDRHLTRPA